MVVVVMVVVVLGMSAMNTVLLHHAHESEDEGVAYQRALQYCRDPPLLSCRLLLFLRATSQAELLAISHRNHFRNSVAGALAKSDCTTFRTRIYRQWTAFVTTAVYSTQPAS